MTDRPTLPDVLAAGDATVPDATPEPAPSSRAVPSEAWATVAARGWLNLTPPVRDWLLTTGDEHPSTRAKGRAVEVLPRCKVGILAGAGAVGKSTAVLDLALAVAAGEPGAPPETWLGGAFRLAADAGGTLPTACGAVLVVLGEEDDADAHRRLYDLARARFDRTAIGVHRSNRAASRLVVVPGAGRSLGLLTEPDGRSAALGDSAFLTRLRVALANPPTPEGWALVVLDPFSRFAPGDAEKDNAIATRTIETIETIAGDSPGKPAVLVAHHTSQAARKDGGGGATDLRGVTGLSDGVRFVLTFDDVSDEASAGALGADARLVRVSLPKGNYGPPVEPVTLRRVEGGRLRPLTEPERAAAYADKADAAPKGARKGARKGGPATGSTPRIVSLPVDFSADGERES